MKHINFKLKNSVLLILIEIILNSKVALAAEVNQIASEKKHVKHEVLLKFKENVDEKTKNAILDSVGGKVKQLIKGPNVIVLQLPEQALENSAILKLKNNKEIDFVELNQLIPPPPQLIVNDTYYQNGWHLPKINSPLAWDLSTGEGVTVAVLDTGFKMDHPDLVGKFVKSWNFFNNTSDVTDVYGHGTLVAGTIAAISNNQLGVASIAHSSMLFGLKISGDDGYGSWSAMASALTFAADNGARVANISYMVNDSSTVSSAAQYFKNKGGLVVHSGGNGNTLYALNDNTTMISVAATDGSDNRASFSNWGPYIDIAAPGVGIWTTTSSNGYGGASGTSFSSPIVASVIALMMSANPGLPPNQIESILKSSSLDLGAAGRDDIFGSGRVDAYSAVSQAKSTVAIDGTSPTVSIQTPTSGSILKGMINVNVSASDNVRVSKVELYLSNNLISTLSEAPYQFSVNTTSFSDGNYNLIAKAYDDAGNLGSSTAINIQIYNTIDLISPVINSISPVDGSKISGTKVSIIASSTDNIAVVKSNLYINDKVVSTSTNGSLIYSWNLRKVSAGTYKIKVEAIDQAGNTTTKVISLTK